MSTTMRSAVARAAGQIELQEVEIPRPGPGEVLLRVQSCGICGSDLHWYSGRAPLPRACPGHEISAVVAELGAGVVAVCEGDRVAVEGLRGCGVCSACRAGQAQRCRRCRAIGGRAPGGFADYLLQAERHVVKVPAAVDDDIAQLTEPLAVSLHAVRLGRLAIGERVLVLGAGTIGLTAVVAALAGGAGEVMVTAKRPQQRAAALALGTARVFAPDETDALAAFAREHPIDLVVETVGDGTGGSTIAQAISLVRKGGRIVLAGVFFTRPLLPVNTVMFREISLLGAVGYGQDGPRSDFELALDVLARRGEELRRVLITHRFALDDIAAAFRTAADREAGAIKVGVRAAP